MHRACGISRGYGWGVTRTRTYLDSGGGTPLHPAARTAMVAALEDGWADPRRLHSEGRRAALLLDAARQVFADVLGTRPEELRFTPSHTAGLHAAVLAVAGARHRVGNRVVVSAVERAAVLAAAEHAGEAVVVPVDRSGQVDLVAWRAALAAPTAVAALQHANGEVGTLQPVAPAWEAARAAGVPLLVDAGASVGHVEVAPAWDVLAANPADWGGPPGIGVLALRSPVRTRWPGPEDAEPWAPGGVSVPAAVGAAAALQAVLAERAESDARRRALVARIRNQVLAEVSDVDLAGDPDRRLPHVLTFSCLYVDGEALVTELDRRGFAVGSGSACTTSSLTPSHVLAAMGMLTHGNVRIALGPEVTDDDVDRFCAQLPEAVAAVRALST